MLKMKKLVIAELENAW